MNKSELLTIIANGENSGVEFKRNDSLPEQLAKEVVALANLRIMFFDSPDKIYQAQMDKVLDGSLLVRSQIGENEST